jgi:MFS transporter, SHS family, lactate transporter
MADNYTSEKAVGDTQVENPVRRHEQMSAGRYFATRFSTLKPPMNKAPNPFKLILLLNKRQWAFFFVGFIAWVYCPTSNSKIALR